MKQFYVGVGAIIEKDGKFLVLRRSAEKDYAADTWEVVTGRLEEDEDPKEGLLREVKEETNLEVEILMPIDTGFFYRGGKEYPMVFVLYWCRYLSGEIKTSWEHSKYKWITLDEAIAMQEMGPFINRFKIIKKIKKIFPDRFSFYEH
ncbi:MAG: NUDIX domain-containing protein [Asgard group archaeon]|nr:NUDIX domain-containing protein [Asgard group archaeon]